MTNPLITGYIETEYLSESPYLGGTVQDFYGMQVKRTIVGSTKPIGMEVQFVIKNSLPISLEVSRMIQDDKPIGVEVARNILNLPVSRGVEVQRVVADQEQIGIEVQRVVADQNTFGMEIRRDPGITQSTGIETNLQIFNTPGNGLEVNRVIQAEYSHGVEAQLVIANQKPQAIEVKRIIIEDGAGNAMEVRLDHSISHWICNDLGYLNQAYLETPYLAAAYCAQSGMEIRRVVGSNPETGIEINRVITDSVELGAEIRRVIESSKATGVEVARFIGTTTARGMETNRVIRADKKFGMEILRIIHADKALGMEIERVFSTSTSFQIRVVLYNTNKLRILCDFPSRGSSGSGLNMWGNAKGSGLNWGASSTAPGDFSPNNLNTDIVEQVWRSNSSTSAVITCDTEINQGVPVDTIGILNHNLTSSAIVTFESSDAPNFSPIRESFGISVDRINMFYVAPTFPTKQYRYRRLTISDPTNPDGYIQIGTVIFGTASIFTKEDLVDEIIRRNKHFADKVQTEGFTNVSNDRALKRSIQISFDSLPFDGPDLQILLNIFDEERTSLKCLWIPDPRDPKRFAVFGKLATLPDERHRKMGPNEADIVTLAIEIDESL